MDQAPKSVRSPERSPIATPMQVALTKDIRPMYGMSGRLVDVADKFLSRHHSLSQPPLGPLQAMRLALRYSAIGPRFGPPYCFLRQLQHLLCETLTPPIPSTSQHFMPATRLGSGVSIIM